jgi:hypothetical protein
MPDRSNVSLTFDLDDAGEEELTWGQADLWLAMRRMRTWLPIGGVSVLPAGATVDRIVDNLRFLVGRHQSLRTRLRLPPGQPARQVVTGSGAIPVEVLETATGEDPAKLAEQVEQRFRETGYDFTADWPIRTAVIRHHGVPTHHVFIMCHLVTDVSGMVTMRTDVAARDPVTGRATTPAAQQPLELARWQRSPAGQRLSEAALRRWEEWLRTVPPSRFGDSPDPRRPRYWQVGFRSPALRLAVRALAARTGVDAGTVLLALFAVAVARTSGVNPAVTRVLVNNRFRPSLTNVVAPISHGGLLVVDVANTTVDEVLARTRRWAMSTYKYAYYDPYRMQELVDRVGLERGQPVDIGCFFNDRRVAREEPADGPIPARADVLAALPHSTYRCELQQDEPLERLFVHVNDAPDAVDLTVLTDTHYIAPADLQALICGMEELAVTAAFDPATPTGVAN